MSTYYCQHCNDELTYTQHFRSAFCEKPACQRAKVQFYSVDLKKKLAIEVVLQADKYLSNSPLDKINLMSKEIKPNIALFPFNNKGLVPLCDERKSAFLLHLTSVFNAVEEKEPLVVKSYSTVLNEPLSVQEENLLGKACATCEGFCCQEGKTHAFQDYASLKYFLSTQSPSLQLKDLLNLYQEYFPEKSYDNACIFQAEQGCALPSDFRSFTCKNYQCESLKSYHHDLVSNEEKLTYSAAVEGECIKNIRIFNKEHFLSIPINTLD